LRLCKGFPGSTPRRMQKGAYAGEKAHEEGIGENKSDE
jgi:hypothetical protein